MNLTDKRALVFGGTSGIGLATVNKLAAAGARVVAISRNPDRAAQQVPDGVELVACDTRDADAVAALCERFAPIDLLVNAATGGERAIGPFLAMDMEGYRNSFDKLWGYVHSVRFGAPHVQPEGSIVLVTGSPAQRPKPGQAALASVGGAIEALVRSLARELAPRRINAVSPGITATPIFGADNEQRADMLAKATAQHLLPRPVQPEEVADAIMLVAVNDSMTGQAINVDGGLLLGN